MSTDPAQRFHRTLERHGYGFQYALVKHIEALRTPWVVETTEFPVAFRGGTTHIDLILRATSGGAATNLRLIAECKRPDPSLADWCFVRVPGVPRAKTVAYEEIRVTSEATAYAALALRSGWDSERVYNLAFSIKGTAKGEGSGDARRAIDDAVAQVLRGANGFLEFLSVNRRYLAGEGLNDHRGRVLPVIFTTARLWTSTLALEKSELATGAVPEGSLTQAAWLWLKQNVSPDLRHGLPSDASASEMDTLEDYVLQKHSRAIAIVNTAGVEEFLGNRTLR